MKKLYPLLPVLFLIYWGCEEEVVEDATPPKVTITSPQNGSTVNEIVTITCISSDNEDVAKVELWVNGVTTDLPDNTEPYSFDWNTNTFEDGNYTIIIRSYDTNENTTDSEPIVLTVDNLQSNPQPINITSVVFDNGGFTITWNQSIDGDFSSYELEKSTDSTMNSPSVVFTTDSLEQITYFDTDVDRLIYQYYRITVIDTFDYETKGQIVSSSLDPVPISVNVESVEYTLEEMTISWSESSDGDFKHYNLLYSESESGDKTSVTFITNKSTISHSIPEFNPNNENWFWVEVSDTLGQTSIGTGMTNSLNNQPTPVNVTSVTYDLESMTITWVQSSDNDFVSYELLQSDSEDGTYTSVTVITDQSTTSHSLTEYDPTHENWFKVKVTDFWEQNSTGSGMTNSLNNQPTPVNVTSVTYDLESMTITWVQSSDNDFVSYELLQSDSEDGTYTSVTVITDQSTTSHSLTEYDPSQERWYWIRVTDYWSLTTISNGYMVLDSSPIPSVLYPIVYSDGFQISWSLNNDDDFVSYKLFESLSEDMSNQTLVYETDSRTDTTYLITIEVLKYYQIRIEDYWGLQSISNIEVGDYEAELWGEDYSVLNTTVLNLGGNQLTGSIPPEIGNLTNLTKLYLFNNDLTGSIPSEIGNLTNLTVMSFYNNEFSGSIPSEIGNLTNLTKLYLFNNQLTGEIPVSICDLDINFSLGWLGISNNQLCPPYPPCIEDYVEEQDTSNCD